MYLCVPRDARLKGNQQMVFVIEMQRVLYAVWTSFWNIMYMELRFRCYAVAEAVSRRPFPAVAQVRSRPITCDICRVQIDN